jgi:hypothetical protein
MRKHTAFALSLLTLVLVVAGSVQAAGTAGTWKGEIVDVACYAPNTAKGAGHADCAKKCVKAGQPMGLLTADGDLVLLAASHDDGKPFEAAKELAGKTAEVSGKLDERGGVKVITVTGVKAAG